MPTLQRLKYSQRSIAIPFRFLSYPVSVAKTNSASENGSGKAVFNKRHQSIVDFS
jgi:hypothetical protein